MQAEDLQRLNSCGADLDRGGETVEQPGARYGLADRPVADAAGARERPVGVVGQVAPAAEEPLSLPDGFVKRKLLESLEGIAVDKGTQRPAARDRRACLVDQRPNALRLDGVQAKSISAQKNRPSPESAYSPTHSAAKGL